MIEIDSGKGAELVARIERAGVMVTEKGKFIDRLAIEGDAAEILRNTIVTAGAYGIRFTAAERVIDEPALFDAFASVVARDHAADISDLLMGSLTSSCSSKPKPNDKLEGLRQLVRHYYFPILISGIAVVALVAAFTTVAQAIVVALALFPVATAGWYFSSPEIVHGLKFSEKSKTEQVNTMFTVAGFILSTVAFLYAVPTLF